ncbi:MAG: MBL fold metallo-hydrolase [Pseudomonadota bacterium]
MADITAFYDPATGTVTYLVADGVEAAIIDPVLDFDPADGTLSAKSVDAVLGAAETRGLRIVWVLDTHAHADHLSAADEIRRRTGARIGIGARITEVQSVFKPMFNAEDVTADGAVFDALFEDGARIPLGATEIEVMATPGHTPACVTYLVDGAAFVGDTIFMPEFGTARTDFPGGDAATLYRSVRRILALPDDTRIFVGHVYPEPGEEARWETTVAAQKRANIHVHDGVSEADYVAMREARDATLDAPRLILPSLQVNIRAGALPAAESDGRVYLKTPVRMA